MMFCIIGVRESRHCLKIEVGKGSSVEQMLLEFRIVYTSSYVAKSNDDSFESVRAPSYW